MKKTSNQNQLPQCRVSDRAFRKFITRCHEMLTQQCATPRVIMQVMMMVIDYLTNGNVNTDVFTESRLIFKQLLPEMDIAIKRSQKARDAAARRRERIKKSTAAPDKNDGATIPDATGKPLRQLSDGNDEFQRKPLKPDIQSSLCNDNSKTSDTVLT